MPAFESAELRKQQHEAPRCARRCPCLLGHTHGCLPCWAHPSTQVKECRRLLRPGGVLAIVDNNPRSKVGCKGAWCAAWQQLHAGWLLDACPAAGVQFSATAACLPPLPTVQVIQNLPPVLFTLMKR